MPIRRYSAEKTLQRADTDFQERRALIMSQALRCYARIVGGAEFADSLPDGDESDIAIKVLEAGQIIEMIEKHFPGHGESATEHARIVAVHEIFSRTVDQTQDENPFQP